MFVAIKTFLKKKKTLFYVQHCTASTSRGYLGFGKKIQSGAIIRRYKPVIILTNTTVVVVEYRPKEISGLFINIISLLFFFFFILFFRFSTSPLLRAVPAMDIPWTRSNHAALAYTRRDNRDLYAKYVCRRRRRACTHAERV